MSPQHLCHAHNCRVPVPPRLLMCREHWYMVPLHLRDLVWANYRPGQEIDKQPTPEYLDVAQQAIDAVRQREESRARRDPR